MSENRPMLKREVPFEIAEDGDGRTIEARIVPYGVAATVADPPDFRPYQEQFAAGAFNAQLNAASRVKVWLNFEHQGGLQGIVGHGVEVNDRDDGLYGSFRVHENQDGDKALQLVRDGLLTGLSMEFAPLKSVRRNGVVERIRAHLDKVSLCRIGAYQGAEVLAVREAADEEIEEIEDEALATPEGPPFHLLETLRDRGLEIPEDLFERQLSTRPWSDFTAADYTLEQWHRACLIHLHEGPPTAKDQCKLPVREPAGAVNRSALSAAAAVLAGGRGGVDAPTDQRQSAARKLMRMYNEADMDPPESLRRLAGSGG